MLCTKTYTKKYADFFCTQKKCLIRRNTNDKKLNQKENSKLRGIKLGRLGLAKLQVWNASNNNQLYQFDTTCV